MGVKPVGEVLVIGPASKKEEILKKLAMFNEFHTKERSEGGKLYERASALERRLARAISSLNLSPEPGVMEVLKKGYRVSEIEFKARSLHSLLEEVERGGLPFVEEVEGLLNKEGELAKKLEELRVQRAFLQLLSTVTLDLGRLRESKRFCMELVTLKAKDLTEFKKSLPGALVVDEGLTPRDVLTLVVDRKEREEYVERVIKAFEARPAELPAGLPMVPSKAFRAVEDEILKVLKELNDVKGELLRFRVEKGERLLAFWEATKVVKEGFEKDTGGRRFFRIRGYVPKDRIEELSKVLNGVADVIPEERPENPPTILENKKYVKSFEPVTLAQGPPSHNEIDPTPIISLIFPIFYGMMFADAGQGILLLLFGLYIFKRAKGSLRGWGMALMSFGIAAIIAGLAIGEAFGFELGRIPIVGEFLARFTLIHVKEFSSEVVGKVLTVGILFGIFHITMGLVIDLYQGIREGEKGSILTEKLPSLLLYLGGLLFAFAFIGGGFSFSNIFSESIAPLIGLPCYLLSYISLPIIGVAVFLLILGRPIFERHHGESLGMMLIEGVVEFLLKIVEFMANTISYARLGILMLVHVALMMVVNFSLSAGLIGIPLVIIGNIGVMMLEGLIVYIQALRLHIYEWFTKFYKGEGFLFRRFVPETIRAKIKWEG